MRAAIYARVSTLDQEPENQLIELRRYVEARHWAFTEFVDRGVSGSKDRRPALDLLLKDAKRLRFDVLVCWRLDRLGRNLRHLVTVIEDLDALGIAFVSLNEGIDCTTPAGRLQLHVLAALAEFERARIQERVRAGLARARAQGKRLGRPRRRIDSEKLATVAGLPERKPHGDLGFHAPLSNAPWPKNPPIEALKTVEIRAVLDVRESGPETDVFSISAEGRLKIPRSQKDLAMFAPGQIVTFRQPDPDEVGETFIVLEMRGDRVLVGSRNSAFENWRIKPTSVYLVADLRTVEEAPNS